MPTYAFRCRGCEIVSRVFTSVRRYCDGDFERPVCSEHGPMERLLETERGNASEYASFGDRHYENLVATDGTLINSRSKHREYMRAHGLTTLDDYKGEFATRQKQREDYRQAKHTDKELRETIAKEVYKGV